MPPWLSAVVRSAAWLIPVPLRDAQGAAMGARMRSPRRECAHGLGWWNPLRCRRHDRPIRGIITVSPASACQGPPGERPAPLFKSFKRLAPVAAQGRCGCRTGLMSVQLRALAGRRRGPIIPTGLPTWESHSEVASSAMPRHGSRPRLPTVEVTVQEEWARGKTSEVILIGHKTNPRHWNARHRRGRYRSPGV